MNQNITSKYIYREHIRQPLKFFLGSFIYILSLVIYFTSIIAVSDKKFLTFEAFKIFTLAMLPMFIGIAIGYIILYFTMYRKMKAASVILSDESLIYNDGKKEISIAYEEITALKFPSIKYTGGWVKIVYGKKSIRLTVVLENIGELIKELKEKLDALDKSDTYKEKKLYSFYKTSSYSDFSWQRVYDNFFFIIAASLINMAVCFGLTFLVLDMKTKFIIGLCGCLTLLTGFIISDIILGIIFAKKSKSLGFLSNLIRDFKSEKLVYKIIYPLSIVVQIIIILFLILG